MINANQLVEAFKILRRNSGMTLTKVADLPYLYQAFDLPNAEAFMNYMEYTFPEDLPLDREMEAAFSALAFRYPSLINLRARRLKLLGVDQTVLENVEKNQARLEDRGFREMAERLISKASPEVIGDKSAVQRLERQVRELLQEADELRTRQDEMRLELDAFSHATANSLEMAERYTTSIFRFIENHMLNSRTKKTLINVLGDMHSFSNSLDERLAVLYESLRKAEEVEDEL